MLQLFVVPEHQKLSKSASVLDLPEYRFHYRLARRVHCLASFGLQFRFIRSTRVAVFGKGRADKEPGTHRAFAVPWRHNQ